MNPENNKTPNHLIKEKSPYLLQHAYNPVDWYPWSEEAFARAKAEDKPIFLSIGYSTCHWCHVMERESFEDEEVAAVLNAHFVAIKVDKEERPDVDNIYMSVCMALHGHGGWPLTILMTPEQVPFFAGTYLPKYAIGGHHGLMELLSGVTKTWQTEKEKLLQAGDQILEVLKGDNPLNNKEDARPTTLGTAFHQYRTTFDKKYGGFGNAPKFPTPHNLLFLLRYSKLFQNEEALNMAETTLKQMYRGGIYDHIGGGFSRYSTDKYWLVPHFEKMLYDNALLVLAYVEAFQATQNPLYRQVTEETLAYITREMQNQEGGFYCAQDADSEGEEGKYYTFTPKETEHILGDNQAKRFNEIYNITLNGNFEGVNIPNLIARDSLDFSDEEATLIQQCKEKLYQYRLTRTHLHKDDKCLTSWNALMIAAFARAYQVFGNEKYLESAQRAISFVENYLTDQNKRLFVRYRDGESYGNGHIDDYAFLCYAHYEMYEATFELKYLEKCISLMKCMLEHFWDQEAGGFYFYAKDAEQLILRPKEMYDGAMPSGNSVALYMLCKLERLTGEMEFKEYANRQLKYMNGYVEDYPSGYGFAMLGYLQMFSKAKDLVCLLQQEDKLREIKNVLSSIYEPNLEIVVKTPDNSKQLEQFIPYTKDYTMKNQSMEFYYCEDYACKEPVHSLEELMNFFK